MYRKQSVAMPACEAIHPSMTASALWAVGIIAQNKKTRTSNLTQYTCPRRAFVIRKLSLMGQSRHAGGLSRRSVKLVCVVMVVAGISQSVDCRSRRQTRAKTRSCRGLRDLLECTEGGGVQGCCWQRATYYRSGIQRRRSRAGTGRRW